MTEPSLRKPVGMFAILLIIAIWLGLVLVVAPYVLTQAWPIQAAFFGITGIAWIFPLKPLLKWMETGRFR